MILESISFANEFTISDLELKIVNGYFDEFLKDYAVYVMTEKGIVKINKDTKSIEYNPIIDLSNYVIKDGNKVLSANDYTDEDKTLVEKISNKSDKGESYTKAESDNKYVAKEANKQLMTKAESDKLATLSNYDDSEIKSEINTLKTTKLNIGDLDSYALKQDVDNKISTIKDENGYLQINEADELPEANANYRGKIIMKQTYIDGEYPGLLDEYYICIRSSNVRDGANYEWKKLTLS